MAAVVGLALANAAPNAILLLRIQIPVKIAVMAIGGRRRSDGAGASRELHWVWKQRGIRR